jgi:SAM-dependent methyltransferase
MAGGSYVALDMRSTRFPRFPLLGGGADGQQVSRMREFFDRAPARQEVDKMKLAPEQDPNVWNTIATQYATHIHPVTAAYADDLVRLADLRQGERVLDVACGAGAVSIPAAKRGADVLATDISPTFVAMVEKRANDAGLENLNAAVMDGQKLELPNASFDAAISNFGVFLFPDRTKGFQEMRRVLKASGRAVVTSFVGPPENEWMALMGRSAMETFPDAPPLQPPKFIELGDPKRLESELMGAGFSQVAIETIPHAARWKDAESAWTALTQGAPVFRPLLDRVGPEGATKLRSTFLRLTKERFGDAGAVTLAAPAHFAVARP